ncbi:phosphate-starvation-inducible PsiE family protein [Thermus thalpophilus]
MRFFPRAEGVIYLFAGLLVTLGAAYLLVGSVVEGIGLLFRGEGHKLAIFLLDRVLLALMMAEILYTLVRFAKEGQLQVEPFLIIGIIAGVRRILVVTAEGLQKFPFALDHPGFQAVLAELFLLSLMILVLAAAYRLVQR